MSSVGDPWNAQYELTPVLKLPEVDLAISIRTRLLRNETLAHVLRVANRSSAIVVAYLVYLAIVTIMFFTPASIGRILGIIGTIIGMPGAFSVIAYLRYDIVVLLLTTYEVWFFIVVSTIVTALLSVLLHDERCSVIVLSWFSFLLNVFTDASIVGLRRLWIPQMLSSVCYSVMYVAIGTEFTDHLHFFDLFQFNGHSFPAAAIVRNGLSTMVVVVLRSIYREFRNTPAKSRVGSDAGPRGVECVSYRCRLRVQAVHSEAVSPPTTISKMSVTTATAFGSASSTKTPFHFVPFFQSVDPRNTVAPDRWMAFITCRNRQPVCLRAIFLAIGCIGFSISSAATFVALLAPALASQPGVAVIANLGTAISLVFVSVCMGSMQRQVLRAVITSFDFLFIGVQGTIVHIALVELTRWEPVMVQAMLSSWFWSSWILCWDAILPPARQTLGLKTRFAACVGIGLIVILATCTSMTLMVLPPDMVHDRVILTFQAFGQTVELRPFSWYVSCSASISAWSVRVMWRLCRANEDELVVLDGPVVYERRMPRTQHNTTLRPRVPSAALRRPSAPHTVVPFDAR